MQREWAGGAWTVGRVALQVWYTTVHYRGETMEEIQVKRFHDGTFVLHKVYINGHKYSAWYNADGKVFSAERYARMGQTVVNVPLERQHEVRNRLDSVGGRYV